MFYGYFLFWIVTSGLEGILGCRYLSRFFDVFGGIIFATFCIIWLFVIFPFDFSNFTDLLPVNIRFLLGWITNDIARILMLFGIIIHIIALIYSPIAYKFVQKNPFKNRKNS